MQPGNSQADLPVADNNVSPLCKSQCHCPPSFREPDIILRLTPQGHRKKNIVALSFTTSYITCFTTGYGHEIFIACRLTIIYSPRFVYCPTCILTGSMGKNSVTNRRLLVIALIINHK